MATMRRRDFVTLIGSTALMPFAARAQATMPAIGFLNIASREGYGPYLAAFQDGLKEGGFEEGRNVAIEYRWADGQYDRLSEMAQDLVRKRVAVIVANSPANQVAKKTTDTVPIVFTTAADPVQVGLVSNLRRPGGNVTGVSQLNAALGPKRIELAHELAPSAPAIALLLNTGDPVRTGLLLKEAEEATRRLQLKLDIERARNDAEIENAFTKLAQAKESVLVIGADAYFNSKSRLLAELALRYRLPTIYEHSEFTDAGGLMSYGGDIRESYRWAGIYAARILKGEKPADLPVQQSTTVELIVNLKTAKMLGVTVPLSLLGRADKIIE
jgi:putative tryptophan/tyrosine transport system substrate-binding protein